MTATLADLRTEEARINSEVAQAEYGKRLKETCTVEDTSASALKVRTMLLAMTGDLVNGLLSAIEKVADETEAHYRMTDYLLNAMNELAAGIESTQLPMQDFGEFFKRGAKPRDLLTVSQWSDKNRWLESGTNIPGKWQTSRTPHLKDIMDDMSVHSPVEQVTFVKSSGVGGTEALYNIMGYIMDHVQKDMMAVVPTLELRERSLNPRIDRMINETKCFEHIKNDKRNKGNRSDILQYSPTARLIKTGANSDEAARMDHVYALLGDEVSAWAASKGEGHRVALFKNRLRTMTRRKIYLVATPVDEEDAICTEFNAGDQRHRHVPCPHCGEYQKLEFGGKDKPYGLKWRLKPTDIAGEMIVDKAWYLCKHCQVNIDEVDKDDMLDRGRWVATYPHRTKHHSYHINALYIKTGLGWTWREIAQAFLDSLNDTDKLKTFEQTTLGLPWVDKGEEVESSPLLLRKKAYEGTPWLIITAFVDVQKDRLEVGFEGWLGHVKWATEKDGSRTLHVTEENWKIDYIILPGDTAKQDVWDELAETLKLYDVRIVGVDYGYNSSMVADFVKAHSYAVATKGYAGQRPLIEDEKKRKQRLRVRRKKGVPVEPLGVDQGKALVYSRLRNSEPGPGYVHFPDDSAFDEEYFEQLTAEKLVERVKGMKRFYEWVQKRPRNEALDIAVGNLAMIKLLNVDWEQESKLAMDGEKPVVKKAVIVRKNGRHY